MAAAKAERGAGAYEMPVLYEKMDGMYLALQWKDRLEHGLSREMKVFIAYFGVYESTNPCQHGFLCQHGAGKAFPSLCRGCRG